MPSLETFGYAFIGGILPPLLWLYFLLKEDAEHPEPKVMIALAFVCGMLAVPLVLPLEQAAAMRFGTGHLELLAWAATEETMKYLVAAVLILWRKDVDEPIDYVIYMVTIALGFAAAENSLFIFQPLAAGHLLTGFETDDLRFLGPTLLHVFASSAIGFALAFSANKGPALRALYAAIGLILAVSLHTAFNALMLYGTDAFPALFLVWTAAVAFFALFEILKYFQYRKPAT